MIGTDLTVTGNGVTLICQSTPALSALQAIFDVRLCQPASEIGHAKWRFVSMFLTTKVSTTIAWFSSTSRLDNLCWKSALALARRSCAFATCKRILTLFFDPFRN